MRPEHFLEAQALTPLQNAEPLRGRVPYDLLYLFLNTWPQPIELLARILAATATPQDTSRRHALLLRYAAETASARRHLVQHPLLAPDPQDATLYDFVAHPMDIVRMTCHELDERYPVCLDDSLAYRAMLEAFLDPDFVGLPYPITAHPDDPHWTGIP